MRRKLNSVSQNIFLRNHSWKQGKNSQRIPNNPRIFPLPPPTYQTNPNTRKSIPKEIKTNKSTRKEIYTNFLTISMPKDNLTRDNKSKSSKMRTFRSTQTKIPPWSNFNKIKSKQRQSFRNPNPKKITQQPKTLIESKVWTVSRFHFLIRLETFVKPFDNRQKR